jgi:peroxiredoxin family protein
MTCDMMGLGKSDFIDGVIDGVTASDFIDMTDGAQIIFI